nr:LysR family transcriptional regulator [uncultured Holophaga sp.]
MDLSKLPYFIAVAERLSFTAAAEALCISQSTVSRHVQDFEQEVGRPLLLRNHRSVRLTPAGALLLEEARESLARMEAALQKARGLEGGLLGRLRIGVLGTPEQKLFPGLLKRFRRQQPGVELEIQRFSWRRLNEQLQRGRLDLGFTLSMGLEDYPDLDRISLCSDRLMVVLPSDHPFAGREHLAFQELAGEAFILPSRIEAPAGSAWFAGLCAEAGFTPRIVAEPELMETVLMMVESGLGISVLAGHVAQPPHPGLRFVPFADESSRTDLVLAWRRDNPNPAIPAFVEASGRGD